MSTNDGHRSEDQETAKDQDLKKYRHETGEHLTTNQGLQISDDQNSLRAGARGPTLLEDFHLREKITHFDQERIPERVVHARGAAAHGYFQVYESLSDLTKAAFLQDPTVRTPVFVRFSTVAGSRGSADTPRDVRGFATKFYTPEGVWDLVGNNFPVFFIQDAIKFPDFVHSVKPEPHNEIPQAASAHDTFWDFVSLTPESTHMLMWVMSDRALPRSFGRMEGFGVHTFRLVNAQGKARFVKFHWKPVLGVHSLVWNEAQKISGMDPDFNRRDLWESIEKGMFPEWELGLQLIEEADEFSFDFDLLDPTKIIPEEQVAVRLVGKLTLNRNPDNFFAETEQVAFHPGHIVPGIDFTNDPLLQGRLFSYLDTQLRRVGPNFAELPINKPVNPVHNNQRDAMGRIAIDSGRVSYFPNSLAGGCPMHSPKAAEAFSSYTEKIEGNKIRERSDSFSDHFSQATMFWNSMAGWEKQHIVEAFSFELNKVETIEIRTRVVNDLLANVHPDLAKRVADNIGVTIRPELTSPRLYEKVSPALSLENLTRGTIKGRVVGLLAVNQISGAHIDTLLQNLKSAGVRAENIAPTGGKFGGEDGHSITVDKTLATTASVFYDGVVLLGNKSQGRDIFDLGRAKHFVAEAFMHGKTIGAFGAGVDFVRTLNLPDGYENEPGIVLFENGDNVVDFTRQFLEELKAHRHFNRLIEKVSA
ncbi:MAG: catalase [Verrucomicrobia bacterium]|nr:catalase [Verrucomicrobiota bacterium]